MGTDLLLQVTTIAYNSTVVVLSFGAVFTFLKARRDKEIQDKHDFLSCTERYIKIQETILNTESLSSLNLSIYKTKMAIGQGAIADTFSKELALCAMMFQLMEDVWLTHELETHKDHELYSGWIHLFKDWMAAEPVSQKWNLLRDHFSKGFVAYIEREYLRKSNA